MLQHSGLKKAHKNQNPQKRRRKNIFSVCLTEGCSNTKHFSNTDNIILYVDSNCFIIPREFSKIWQKHISEYDANRATAVKKTWKGYGQECLLEKLERRITKCGFTKVYINGSIWILRLNIMDQSVFSLDTLSYHWSAAMSLNLGHPCPKKSVWLCNANEVIWWVAKHFKVCKVQPVEIPHVAFLQLK